MTSPINPVLPGKASGESLPERLRVNSCRYAHETMYEAAKRRIATELEAAARIQDLEEALRQARDRMLWIKDVRDGKTTGLPQVDAAISHIDALLSDPQGNTT